ncbi:flagellin [Nocardioides sp. CER19]|uniref:flagellin N-terminal helical domain-containing protein n=1 Tax=Nocardioides sp. CER19 TaxID=3038538 RepID=UPI0024489A0F|nr:flagellin [Nocardioides sp. CER19]MDH2414645.1 flagellin [Nocardioides sp. CER19]
MSLRINTNVDALTAYRNLSTTQNSMSTSIERLSSGLRINKAADDAAGLAISQGLTAQINGIGQAQRNAQDGINVVQTADGALTETHSILQRMRTLAVQSANDSNDQNSRDAIQSEVTALSSELDRIANKTTFNNVNLLNGSFTGKKIQVGYAKDDNITVDIQSASGGKSFDANGLGLSGISLASQSGANAAIATLDTAIKTVSTARADLGALQNRFQHTINNLAVTQQNLQASNSAIQDTDMAAEMSNYTRSQILSQAGTSMLKQANSAAQSVLSLLQ